MPETIIDLGKKVKSKYPGQYDDIDDAEVGRKVKAKFPGQYDDFTDVSSAKPPDDSMRSVLHDVNHGYKELGKAPTPPGLAELQSMPIPPSTMGEAIRTNIANDPDINLIEGMIEPLKPKNLWEMLKSGLKTTTALTNPSIYQAATGENPVRQVARAGADVVTGTVAPVGETIEGAMTNDPKRMMHGLGGVATQTIPAVFGAAKGLKSTNAFEAASGKFRAATAPATAEELLARSRQLRDGITSPNQGIPLSRSQAVTSAVKSVGNPIRRILASRIDRRVAGMPEANVPAPSLTQRMVDFQSERIPFTKDTNVYATERPGVPQHIQDALDRGRYAETPAQQAERLRMAMDEQASASRVPFEKPSTETFPRRAPEPIPQAAPKPPVDPVAHVERLIAPSGTKAKLSTLRNVPRLLKEMPELSNSTPETFPNDLVNGFRRMEQGVAVAEDAVPRETTVPKKPIVDGLKEIADDYAERGLEKSANQVEKIRKLWDSLPVQEIPWETFRDMKRAFFKDGGTGAAMSQAYRVLMDAASPVSKELETANKSYSVGRRALEDAGIDARTGRRIRTVGAKEKLGLK